MVPPGTILKCKWLLGYDNAGKMRDGHQKSAIQAAKDREAAEDLMGTKLENRASCVKNSVRFTGLVHTYVLTFHVTVRLR